MCFESTAYPGLKTILTSSLSVFSVKLITNAVFPNYSLMFLPGKCNPAPNLQRLYSLLG